MKRLTNFFVVVLMASLVLVGCATQQVRNSDQHRDTCKLIIEIQRTAHDWATVRCGFRWCVFTIRIIIIIIAACAAAARIATAAATT